jgi:hypothetical protein
MINIKIISIGCVSVLKAKKGQKSTISAGLDDLSMGTAATRGVRHAKRGENRGGRGG